MREILFRGKRTGNDEWVYGFLVKHPSACYIGTHNPWAINVPAPNPDESGGEYWIDPDTVGQYTGLDDVTGEKIFEGDIVEHGMFGRKAVVQFADGCFETIEETGAREYLKCDVANHTIKVIGNIYDKEAEHEAD